MTLSFSCFLIFFQNLQMWHVCYKSPSTSKVITHKMERGKLLYMLKEKNVDRYLIKIIISFLDNYFQTVKIGEERGVMLPITKLCSMDCFGSYVLVNIILVA